MGTKLRIKTGKPKKVKPETEIRNLKKRISNLELLCQFAEIPPIIIQLPQLVTKPATINKEDIKWAKQKIKEWDKIKASRKC